ncbi:transcriptional regulator NrdR [Candidatus Woesearchaeota archaeon]|jgi:transcriptional repressor NrdR|nr:transcriptional regulator NrdR [Candidatus Woesearchaeota archaeon]
MKCPFCGSLESKVVDKRETEEDIATRRRRECLSCNKRYTTYERLETLPLTIVKKDGTRERFDRAKIVTGLLKACEKRPVQREAINKVTDEIEAELKSADATEIESKKIGQLVVKKLKKLDKIAYIRFASVYKEFKDIEEFDKELHKLLKK